MFDESNSNIMLKGVIANYARSNTARFEILKKQLTVKLWQL